MIMSNLAICRTSRFLAQVAAVAILAGFSAGCSGDVSRFGNVFAETSNQDQIIGRPDPMPTGSINAQATYAQPAYAQPAYTQQTYAAPAPTYPSQGAVSSSALPPAPGAVVNNGAYVRPAQTAGLPPPPTGAVPAVQPWTPSNGTTVTVKPGDSVQVLARRYGVAESSLLAANGLVAGAQLTPGQNIVIPAYGQQNAAVAAPTASATAPGPQILGQLPPVKPPVPKSVSSQVAAAAPGKPGLPPTTNVAMATPSTATDANSGLLPPAGNAPGKQANQQTAALAPSQTQPSVKATTPTSSGVESAADGSFRWPVRGRVISAFGVKPGGERNDGINIEVPEGTPIKAAEGGQVIYAGNELKGFGNLVLVKHSNGFVSAYAHASEVLVQRGDSILRGQTIAKVGATGNVSRPQLHFEIRNGNRPVDPLPYLSG
ncbi:peptidase M23 [Pleomorphomonas diazotrophica]|uniref:Peptidase M23 n=1 Tax=Pleomorphomonas diazotrophica TaxID=1166257 RepID=A0A1I4Q9D3_9HYPH|nr:peptidoglycan DD-metalloendopeptidase family protein [Pleomorphomonas diazotrophica]PKR90846.1 peptidase M23 [Pleomorphomonas diazotrophica]SFM36667.1 LysM domain-containing protein [Pleomorphomonas diazotrophica]